jgi:hypothetical protein
MNRQEYLLDFEALTQSAEAGNVLEFTTLVRLSKPTMPTPVWRAQLIQGHRALFILLQRTRRLSEIRFRPTWPRTLYTLNDPAQLKDSPHGLSEVCLSAGVGLIAHPIMCGIAAEGFDVRNFHSFVNHTITATLAPIRDMDHPDRIGGKIDYISVEITWDTPLPIPT